MMKHRPYVTERGEKKYLRFEEEVEITPNSIYWAVGRMIKGQAVHMTGYIEAGCGRLWNFVMDNYGEIIAKKANGERAYYPPMRVHEFLHAFKNVDARWDVCNTYPVDSSCYPKESFAEMVKRSKIKEISRLRRTK